ncbi:MAG: alkaline phosphatase [Planctomycetes bacterium]|nr:alkaline phosphatase [Planctomycetota bacterium]
MSISLPKRRIWQYAAVLLVLAATVVASGVGRAARAGDGEAASQPAVRNVILMIGDGMGTGQVALGQIAKGKPLCFEGFPHRGSCGTSSLHSELTDSAAAGSAIATGRKAAAGYISKTEDGKSLTTILELYKARGARTGLVTTSTIVDATPAAFAAHASSRGAFDSIGYQMLAVTRPNVVMGGGGMWIDMLVGDEKPVTEREMFNGYTLATTRKKLAAIDAAKTEHLLGLFSKAYVPFELERDADSEWPTLEEMTRAALDIVSSGSGATIGFFIMIEGGRIDHACHGNDAADCAAETVAFDKAVQAAVDWVGERKRWDRTLLIVTADHETGGLEVRSDHKDENGLPDDVSWATGGHTAAPVPIYARGAGAEGIRDIKENTELFTLMRKCLGPAVEGKTVTPSKKLVPTGE